MRYLKYIEENAVRYAYVILKQGINIITITGRVVNQFLAVVFTQPLTKM